MAVVVKWREDGEYLASMYHEQGSPRMGWSKDRKAAIRFDSAKDAARCWRRHTGNDPFGVAFVRLVPKRRAAVVSGPPGSPDREQLGREVHAVWEEMAREDGCAPNAITWERLRDEQKEEDMRIGERICNLGVRCALQNAEASGAEQATASEPTARDGLVGMLFRLGWDETARHLGLGIISPDDAARKVQSDIDRWGSMPPDDAVSACACVAALKALAATDTP